MRENVPGVEGGDGAAEGTPPVEHLDELSAPQAVGGWFGAADPVAAILANPYRLLELPGAGFEIIAPSARLPVGTRGRILGLRTDPEDLWADVLLFPPAAPPAPPGCLPLVSRRSTRDAFVVPFLLQITRPVRLAP